MLDAVMIRWNSLPGRSRIGLAAGVLAVVTLLVAGSIWLLRDDYQILFSDLNAQDASAMVSELERMKVPYRLAENGSAILVEKDIVYKTRLKLMGKGVDLHGAVGLELFSNADFGMTDFAQKVNYQRALQGELARTIMGFDEIRQARVHLVLPESGLFKRANAKPKASISVMMKNGSRLTAEQVSGIQRLVAASVPEIDSGAVTILDQHGIAISKIGGDEPGVALSGRLDAKRQVEDYVTRKIVAVLDRAVGPGRAIVSVDVSFNFDQVKVTQESVVPLPAGAGQNVGAVVRRRESTQGGDTITEQPIAALAGTRTQSSPSSSTVETEFLNGKRVEQVVSEPGSIRRMSVGVLVPDVTDPVELAKLKEVVAMAAGVSTSRGDAIVVYNQPANAGTTETPLSDESASNGAPDTAGPGRHTGGWQSWMGASALVAVGLTLLLWAARRQRTGAADSQPAPLSLAAREEMRQAMLKWAEGGASS